MKDLIGQNNTKPIICRKGSYCATCSYYDVSVALEVLPRKGVIKINSSDYPAYGVFEPDNKGLKVDFYFVRNKLEKEGYVDTKTDKSRCTSAILTEEQIGKFAAELRNQGYKFVESVEWILPEETNHKITERCSNPRKIYDFDKDNTGLDLCYLYEEYDLESLVK